MNIDTRARTNKEADTPSVAELGRCLWILREKKRFHAGRRRTVGLEHLDQRSLNKDQAYGDGRVLVHVDDPVCQMNQTRASPLDDAPPEVARAGVEAEHDGHGIGER